MPTTPSFISTYSQFVEDLSGTFPELTESLKSQRGLEEAEAIRRFRGLWRSKLAAVAGRDANLFEAEGGCEILQGSRISHKMWKEVSDGTKTAIWNYLSTLALLSAAASDATDEDSFWDEEDFKKSMEDMMQHLKEAAEAAGGAEGAAEGGVGSSENPFASFGDIGGLFEKLRDMATGFAAAAGESDGAGTGAGSGGAMPDFKIPERLFKGHIARMAREIAEEFKPEEFGISPEMLESQDPSKIFEFLQEIFTKNPGKLMAAAQKIGKKIQAKFQRGEIKRDEILAEIEELMKEFSDNEAFNSIFGQMGDIMKMSARATGNDGSERRRQVQERLRKKAAEKEAARKTPASVVSSGSTTAAAADAIAASLLAAEDAAKRKKKGGK